MSKLIKIITTSSILACVIFPLAAFADSPNKTEANAWNYNCRGDGGTKYCDVVQSLIDKETKVELVRISFVKHIKTAKLGMLVKVPLGLRLDTGAAIRIDGKITNGLDKLVFSRCLSDGCYVESPISSADLITISNAKKIEIIVLNLKGEPQIVNVVVEGLKPQLNSLLK